MGTLLQLVLSNALAATVLALLAAAGSLAFRKPPLTRALWLLVLLKLVTPPLWHVNVGRLDIARPQPKVVAPPVHRPAAVRVEPIQIAAEPQEASQGVMVVERPVPRADPMPAIARDAAPALRPAGPPAPRAAVARYRQYVRHWPAALAIAWALGAALQLVLIAASIARLRRLAGRAILADATTCARTRQLADSLGLGRCPRVLFVRGPVSPMLCAIGLSPRLLLPAELWARLDGRQRDTVLLHELAHLRRGDHWVRAIEVFVAAIYWWHPVVWWARRALREATEQCCDAWVLAALPRSASSYAAALVEAIDFLSTARPVLPALASGMGQFTDLKRRLVMIKRGTAAKALSWPAFAAVCTLGGLVLPLSPGFAQTAEGPASPGAGSIAQSAPENAESNTNRPSTGLPAAGDQPSAGGGAVATAEPTAPEATPAPSGAPAGEADAPAPTAAVAPVPPNAPALSGSQTTIRDATIGNRSTMEALPDGAREKLLPEARQEVARLRAELARAERRLARLEGRNFGPGPNGAEFGRRGGVAFGGGGGMVFGGGGGAGGTPSAIPAPGRMSSGAATVSSVPDGGLRVTTVRSVPDGGLRVTTEERNAANRIGQAASGNEEQRLDALEAQVHEILSELRQMRHEQRQPSAGPGELQAR